MSGTIHEPLSKGKLVVAQRFLQFRVELPVNNPLLAVFFFPNKIWIQFKIENFPNFCYHYRILDHVTSRCTFKCPTMITTSNNLIVKVYGPWLWAKHEGSMLFINPIEKISKKINEGGEQVRQSSKRAKALCLFMRKIQQN